MRGLHMDFFYLLLAFLAGTCGPAQAGINSELGTIARGPLQASFISFVVGALTLGAYCVLVRAPWPALGMLGSMPWWLWTGGCLGAFLVASTVFVAPKLGAVSLMAAMIAGQMIASLVLDHYGWLGYPVHPVNEWRLLGILLLVAGVMVIRAS